MIKKKHFVSIFFIILLLAIPPALQFEPVFAENKLRQIIKIAENFPANVASYDIPIDPPLENLDRSFLFYTVSHVAESDASDTLKIVKILDKNTVRIIGEDTASGNRAIDIIIVIIEYDSNSEIDVQHIQESLSAVAGSQDFLIGSVNASSAFLINRGVAINGSFTAIGNNDFNRLRILNSTAFEVNIDTAPDTPQGQAIDIVDMNMSDVSVQRGLHTLTGTTSTLTGGVDFTAIDPTRTILLVTYTVDGASSEDTSRITLRAVLSSGGDITFSRFSSTNNVFISWELIEFPSTFVKVTHFNTAVGDGDDPQEVTVSQILDFDKVFAMSHVASPFGNAMGRAVSTVDGRLDLAQAIFSVQSNTQVSIQRDDDNEDSNFGWQLVEFLETDVAENPQGNNTLRQIVKIEDEYLGSSSVNQFFSITPPLLDISKAVMFMSTSNDYSGSAVDVSERIKRVEILNTTTLRITGSSDPSATNEAMPFSATIVEFSSSSPILVQRDQIQYTADSSTDARFLAGEFQMHMSPVNASGTNIMYQGWSGNLGGSGGNDFTYGAEEVPQVRIIDNSQWGYEIDNPIDFQEAVAVVNINDWGQNNISVQRGQGLLNLTLTVSPTVDVIRNQTLLFTTFMSTNNEFDNEPDDLGVLAHLDNSSPPNIIFERTSNTDLQIEISWELISYPLRTLFVQHGIHNMSAGVSNSTSTIPRPVQNVSEAFVIGTINIQNGYSGGKGSLTTSDNFGEVTAKMTLDDTTTARFERGLSVGSFDVGFQVVEFQGNFSVVAMETVGTELETNATGDIVPACCTDGVISNANATYTEIEIDIIHQLLEWFNPTSTALDSMISDIENNGKALFDIILRMNNGTYGVDANLTASAEFYQDQYLTRGNLTDFIDNIIVDVRTNFGASTP